MPEPLRVALIGAGHMGRFHAQALAERDDVDLVAICDTDAARAGEVALKCNTDPETDPARLAGRIDAAVIAAATTAHHALALPLVERGVALLVEKPLAATAQDAWVIARAAEKAGTLVQTGQIVRFDPVTRSLAGRTIDPAYIEVTWAAPFTPRSLDVGVVMDLVIHAIDLVLSWTGEMPEEVRSFGAVVLGPHEDLVNARLAFPSGAVANITASRLSRTRERRVRLFTRDAYYRLDYNDRKAERVAPKQGLAPGSLKGMDPKQVGTADLVEIEELAVEASPDALRAQLDAFLAAVRGERPVACSAADGARAVQVAEQVIREMRAGGRSAVAEG